MRKTAVSLLMCSLLGLLLPAIASPADDATTRHLIKRDGRNLEVFVSTQFKPSMRDNLLQWTENIADALRQVYGHWPNRHWQISISPTAASASDPIPWAQVHREEIDRVEFFTSSVASTAELEKAWTSYHELAHLLIPYRGWGDAWFSEGLASYYQNILQARIGLISEQQMWQKLYDGFQRGLAETQYDGQSLQTVSAGLRENGGFMRVYWGGAWYFLAADTRLRLQSGGRQNLDDALKKLNECCAQQRLSVKEIVSQLDRLNRVLLFRPLYEEVSTATTVLPFDTIFASMGIDIVEGEVRLQEKGPGAKLRREIASGVGLAADL